MTKATEKPALLPKLRFPEFLKTDGWRGEELEKLVTTVSPPVKLQTSSYLLQGKFPIIDQSQDTICGWTNDESTLITEPLPLIVFGDHTCTLKFVEKPFAQGADGIKIIKSNPIISAAYLFQSLNHSPLVMEDYKRHFSILKKRVIYFPDIKTGEQQKIADCLGSIDELITLESQKLDALKRHKKGLMQQLFPAEGETVPKLRFPEFLNASGWKFTPLNKLARRCTQRNRSSEVTRVLTNSAEYGVVDQRDYFDKDIATQGNLENYYVVEKGDYVYNPRISATAPVGPISKNNVATGVMSPLYSVFRFSDDKNDFYAHYFKTTGWHQYMRQASSTGARHDRMAITNNDFMAMPLPVSTSKEQQKIADCLTSLDDRISAQTQKIESLKTHKKGLMQQLFPTMGEV